jgi:hypothetical protein
MARRILGCLAFLISAVAASLPASGQQAAPAAEQQAAPGKEQQPVARPEQTRESLQGAGAPAGGAGPAGEAAPKLDEAAVAKLKERLASELGVEVLDVRPVEANGRQVYAVKVMNPGGNSNDAFLVSTLIVDRESGEVLGRLPQSIDTAAEFSESGARFEPDFEGGRTIRRRTYR